jgi:multiple sugar transport system substrate-binding protein
MAELRGRNNYELMLEEDRSAICPGVFAYINYYQANGQRALGITDVPVMPETGRRASMLGGMGLGIAASSPHRAAAWEYAWYVMSREVQGGVYIRNNGHPARLSALAGPIDTQEHAGFGPVHIRALDGCYIRPRYPGWFYIEQAGGQLVMEYLAGALTVDETLSRLNAAAASVLKSDEGLSP